MLKPLTLVLGLIAPPLFAQTLQPQPLAPSAIAAAQAACATKLARPCLITLAQSVALYGGANDQVDFFLTQIAQDQAWSGDSAGAEFTMTLGHLDRTAVLLALGRWDQALAVAKPDFIRNSTHLFTGEGSFKGGMVVAMLDKGQIALALQTALSIPNAPFDEADIAVKSIIVHHADQGDFAAAHDLLTKIQSQTWRNHALRHIAMAEAKAGLLTEATATLAQVTPLDPVSTALMAQAQAMLAAGNTTRAQHLTTRAARAPLTLYPANQPDHDRLTTLTTELVTLALGPDQTATDTAVQTLIDHLSDPAKFSSGEPLGDMVQDLIDQGSTQTAIGLMARLEETRETRSWSEGIAMALLDHDKTLAPSLLPLIKSAITRRKVTLSWAETLHAQGRTAEAEAVLTDLLAWADTRPKPLSRATRVTIMAAVAGSQRALGLAGQADATLTRAYSLTAAIKTSVFRIWAYRDIAAALGP